MMAEKNKEGLPYRLFWTWDHSTNWCLNIPGSQNSGVGNSYTKDADVFIRDYKRAVDWCAAHKMDALGTVGLLRDAHGGVDSAREICSYAREHGVRIYLIAGLFSYGGIYYEGDSKWSMDLFLKDHPDSIGRKADGTAQVRQLMGLGGNKLVLSGCPSSPELNQFVLDSLDWAFTAIPELGGIQMETGDVGICMCKRCQARRKNNGMTEDSTEMSFNDMAKIYADAAEVIWNRAPDTWIICEAYHHFLDPECDFFSSEKPSKELEKLLQLPEKTFWQWKCDRRLASGKWTGEPVPESLRKFRHIMRAHSGTQWWGGRHTLAVDEIRRQCLLSYQSGLQAVSMFGEGAPFHTNLEFNYLALEFFADHPMASIQNFAAEIMAPRLGGISRAEKYLEFGILNRTPEKIPAAATQIARILHGITDYEVIRRWEYLGSFLNAFYWESQQAGYEKRIESKNLNML